MDIEQKLEDFENYDYMDKINIILTARDVIIQLKEQLAKPADGWKLVPIIATREMIDAEVFHTESDDDEEPYWARGRDIAVYSDMVTAAPNPPINELTTQTKD